MRERNLQAFRPPCMIASLLPFPGYRFWAASYAAAGVAYITAGWAFAMLRQV
jgi:hypothetical protein